MNNGFILRGTRSILANTPCLSMKKTATNDARGTRMKSLSRTYNPKSLNQETYVNYLESKDVDIVFGVGPAGTGKTLFACNAAVGRLRSGSIHKIIITRPVVSVEEDIGFLPGNLVMKMDPWTRPIFDILLEFYSQKEIDLMIHGGVIEIAPLAYMRGRTFKHAFVIADEMQNSSPNQMLMLMTRIGQGSKMVITGDLKQSDRSEDNGLRDVLGKLKDSGGIEGVGYVELDFEDVERSPIVKRVLKLYESPSHPQVKSEFQETKKKKPSKRNTSPLPPSTPSCDWVNVSDDAAIIPREHLTRDDDLLRSPFNGW
jgi:phosphate starvation-inducible PhoH-like protein